MAVDTQNTSSIEIEIDLQQVLSLVGINIPQIPSTGSLPEIPKKIKLKEIKGIVVNKITNEPIPGVVVTNKLLKRDTTNKKGEFSIKHPDITNTGLDPAKFPLNFVKPKYSSFNAVPYTSVGDIKSNLGIITLNPLESNLKKEITDFLRFPPSTVEDYATKDVTFDFKIQKKLNVSIDDLKGIVIPLVLGLIAVYGISEVKKIIEKSKTNPAEAFEEIKDIITCPPKEEMDKLIATKNKLVKKLNDTLKIITQTTDALAISEKILAIASPTIKIIRQLPTPTSVPPGVGIPLNVINKIRDTLKFLDSLVEKLLYVNSTTLAILSLLRSVLSQVVDFLNLLDLLIQFCNESDPNPERTQSQISNELIALTNEQSQQLSPVVTNVNGFTMGVETEVTDKPLKRRRAIATNKQGIVMLKGEFSFSSIDQILIDELVFYIQQNNLKAD
jgi:hypothetical protein